MNELREEAGKLQREIDFLVMEEEDLRMEVEALRQDHERLERLVREKNAGNVDDLLALVHENQLILRQMKVRFDVKLTFIT